MKWINVLMIDIYILQWAPTWCSMYSVAYSYISFLLLAFVVLSILPAKCSFTSLYSHRLRCLESPIEWNDNVFTHGNQPPPLWQCCWVRLQRWVLSARQQREDLWRRWIQFWWSMEWHDTSLFWWAIHTSILRRHRIILYWLWVLTFIIIVAMCPLKFELLFSSWWF